MYEEKVKADHDCEWPAYKCSEDDKDIACISEEPQEDNRHTAKLAKKISDYIRVLRPRVLVSADAEVFEHPLFADLQGRFSQSKADAALDTLCLDAKRSGARTLILVNPVALDVGEVGRRTRCYVLTLKSGGAA